MLSNVAVKSLGEMVSPCLTPLLILIFSLSLCRYTITEMSVCHSGFLCTHLLFLVLAMMSILLGFVLSRMPSRNPRKQHTVAVADPRGGAPGARLPPPLFHPMISPTRRAPPPISPSFRKVLRMHNISHNNRSHYHC